MSDAESSAGQVKSTVCNDLSKLKTAKRTTLTKVTKKQNEITKLMASDNQLHLVKTAFDEYHELTSCYRESYQSLISEMANEDERDAEEERFQDKEFHIVQFCDCVGRWISEAERRLMNDLDRR